MTATQIIDPPAAAKKASGYGAGIARTAYLIRSFMRVRAVPIEVKAAADELGFAASTIHRLLSLMLEHGLASFQLATPEAGKGPGRGRLYVWSAQGTLEKMEEVFGAMPMVSGAPAPGEDPRPQAFPSVFHMGSNQPVYLPEWSLPSARPV